MFIKAGYNYNNLLPHKLAHAEKEANNPFCLYEFVFFKSNPSPLPDVFKTDDDKKDAV
jgi:hypothetical protein